MCDLVGAIRQAMFYDGEAGKALDLVMSTAREEIVRLAPLAEKACRENTEDILRRAGAFGAK